MTTSPDRIARSEGGVMLLAADEGTGISEKKAQPSHQQQQHREKALEWNILLHRAKRGRASLGEVCLRACTDFDRSMHDELVVCAGVVDSCDFWRTKPEVLSRAEQLVINVDDRAVSTRVVEMIRARARPSSPVRVSADFMAAVLVEDETVARRWHALDEKEKGKRGRAFWQAVFRDYAVEAWRAETARMRGVEYDGSMSMSAIMRTLERAVQTPV